MTIIQPQRKSALSRILIFLIVCSVVGTFWLVIFYNRLVDLTHAMSLIKSDFQKTQTENSELKDKIFGLFSGQNIEQLIASRELTKDVNPQYITVDP